MFGRTSNIPLICMTQMTKVRSHVYLCNLQIQDRPSCFQKIQNFLNHLLNRLTCSFSSCFTKRKLYLYYSLERLGIFFGILIFLTDFLRSILAPPDLKSYAFCPSSPIFSKPLKIYTQRFTWAKLISSHFFSTSLFNF